MEVLFHTKPQNLGEIPSNLALTQGDILMQINVLSKEVGKQSFELRTNRIVRLYSMKGGVLLYSTSQ